MLEPWRDWIPGVLSDRQLKELSESGRIEGVENPEEIDYSSIDLHLTDAGFEMAEGSVKPSGPGYVHSITVDGLSSSLTPDADGSFTLFARKTYVFKIRERIHLLKDAGVYGQATGKSSVGRVDVLTRLIVDGMNCYEAFDPEGLREGNGDMFLEITPMTFSVKVRKGASLSQLRLFYGPKEQSEVGCHELYRSVLVSGDEDPSEHGSLSVDLQPASISGERAVAFCAHRSGELAPIPLWNDKSASEKPNPTLYWRFKMSDTRGRLRIEKEDFYILRSKERLCLPSGIAVYCRASDETIGEMRIHYAGFAHPFFGQDRTDAQKGTPLIFEVRGHDVNVSLNDGEKMAELIFYRMSQDCRPQAGKRGSYTDQTLALSKFFGEWPRRVVVAENGRVTTGN